MVLHTWGLAFGRLNVVLDDGPRARPRHPPPLARALLPGDVDRVWVNAVSGVLLLTISDQGLTNPLFYIK